jgi:hypothetical protein
MHKFGIFKFDISTRSFITLIDIELVFKKIILYYFYIFKI